jgi:hypothetical protein
VVSPSGAKQDGGLMGRQSHQWAPKLTHPPEVGPDTHTSPFTSKMIPVAYLAREGFTPVTMGMVLCNDDKIQAFVAMVQSMHSEGVVSGHVMRLVTAS